MLKVTISSNLQQATQQLQSIAGAKQLRFAVARALTLTAKDVQQEVRKNMPTRFTIRRQWVVNGILFERATKDNLAAKVYSRDQFMGLQEAGGVKSPLRNYLAYPLSMVRRTKTDMIRKSDRPAQLGDKAEVVEYKGRKFLALKKPRKGANGAKLRFLYLLIPKAQIKPRLGLEKDGLQVSPVSFAEHLQRTLDEAAKTAR